MKEGNIHPGITENKDTLWAKSFHNEYHLFFIGPRVRAFYLYLHSLLGRNSEKHKPNPAPCQNDLCSSHIIIFKNKRRKEKQVKMVRLSSNCNAYHINKMSREEGKFKKTTSNISQKYKWLWNPRFSCFTSKPQHSCHKPQENEDNTATMQGLCYPVGFVVYCWIFKTFGEFYVTLCHFLPLIRIFFGHFFVLILSWLVSFFANFLWWFPSRFCLVLNAFFSHKVFRFV